MRQFLAVGALLMLLLATLLRLNTCLASLIFSGLCACAGSPCNWIRTFRPRRHGASSLTRHLFCIIVGCLCSGVSAGGAKPFAASWEEALLSLQGSFNHVPSTAVNQPFLFSGMRANQLRYHCPLFELDAQWPRPMLGERVGEALHPGPHHFSISAANPTGVNNKFDLVSMLPPGIYGVSETHLAQVGLQRFRAALRRSSNFRFVPGAPVPLRARSEVSGTYAGVGFLSSYPTRTVPCDWDPTLYATGRLAACSFFIQPVWVLGVTLYGYATGRERTADLVRAAFDRVLAQPSGPRFVSGDFNLTLDEVPHLALLRQHGFRELQEVAQIKFGREPAPTCKQASRKDFVFLSPELQSALMGVDLALDYFPDHGVLTGHFGLVHRGCPVFTWRVPRQRPTMPHALSLQGSTDVRPVTGADARYAALWGDYESRLSDALVAAGSAPLDASERGRACTEDTRMHTAPVVPPAKGRQGEVQPAWHGHSVRHAHWYRQLRRLQALQQALRKASTSASAVLHRASLWNAIRTAAGFRGGFEAWYLSRPVMLPNDLSCVPLAQPALPATSQLFITFQANVDHLEKCLGNLRKRDARAKRSQNPFLVFKDIQAESPAPVETLLAGPQVKVAEYDSDECAITLVDPVQLDPSLPIAIDHKSCGILHAESDRLWLDSTEPVQPGAVVTQDKLLGALPELFQEFNETWGRRWNKHQCTELATWQPAVDTAGVAQPVPPAQFPDITPDLWRAEVRKKKCSSAAGLDSVSRQDLLLLPDDLLQLVLETYAHAESTGVWPAQAMQAVISALEKRPDASRVEHYRPITIISLVYRVWSGIRAKQCLRHLLQFCDPNQHGCLPRRSAACVWYDTQANIELARRAGVTRHGIVTDVIKAFNCIPRPPVYALALLFGIPKKVVMGWQGALHLLMRRFRIRGSVGPGVRSVTGFPEGCGMSCTAVVLLGISFHRFMASRIPSLQACSYVDKGPSALGPGVGSAA